MVAAAQLEVVGLETHPGHETGAVRAPAQRAMAVGAPLAGQGDFEADGAAQATAANVSPVGHARHLNWPV
jgi:hypothetical protein